mgnify:CR=1 FL=1
MRRLTLWQLALLGYIGVVGTALVYPLFHGALGARGVVRAVGFKLLVPVFGIALGVLLLGERLGWQTSLGAVVVIGAIAAIQFDRARVPGMPGMPGMPAARRAGPSDRQGVA